MTASAILMVRPSAFGFNGEAAATNRFARDERGRAVAEAARREFDGWAERLDQAGVEVHVLDDPADPPKPDAVFPNNWVSFHPEGLAVLYPMANGARRAERRREAVEVLLNEAGFHIGRWLDLTHHERAGRFLEGTGSLVLDHARRRAFAGLSGRTHRRVLEEWAELMDFEITAFEARDPDGYPIYHTNVMLSLGRDFAAVCLDAVVPHHRARLVAALEMEGRTIVDLSWAQIRNFAANILELRTRRGARILALSRAAFDSLDRAQRNRLETLCGQLVYAAIPTIERIGGGGARCMIAEVRLPRTTASGGLPALSA